MTIEGKGGRKPPHGGWNPQAGALQFWEEVTHTSESEWTRESPDTWQQGQQRRFEDVLIVSGGTRSRDAAGSAGADSRPGNVERIFPIKPTAVVTTVTAAFVRRL